MMPTITFGTSTEAGDLVRLFIEHLLDRSDAKVVSSTSTSFVIECNAYGNHDRAVVKGSNFSYGADGFPIQGTITNWTRSTDSGLMGTAKNLKLSAAGLMAAGKASGIDAKGVILKKAMSGNDVLNGSRESDRMDAYAGKDTLYGGRGGDSMSGGKGADKFVYKSVSDSRPETATSYGDNRDFIWDFSHKEKDKIDLKTIDANTKKAGNQAFTFLGKSAFTKKAGELRYKIVKDPYEGGKGAYVQGDVNGDGKADLEIYLARVTKLVKDDFFL